MYLKFNKETPQGKALIKLSNDISERNKEDLLFVKEVGDVLGVEIKEFQRLIGTAAGGVYAIGANPNPDSSFFKKAMHYGFFTPKVKSKNTALVDLWESRPAPIFWVDLYRIIGLRDEIYVRDGKYKRPGRFGFHIGDEFIFVNVYKEWADACWDTPPDYMIEITESEFIRNSRY